MKDQEGIGCGEVLGGPAEMMNVPQSEETLADHHPAFDVQVSGCNRTVWVNAADGSCIGRFSKVFGIDVHRTGSEQMAGERECLFCTHTKAGPTEWDQFREAMLHHHGVALANDLLSWG